MSALVNACHTCCCNKQSPRSQKTSNGALPLSRDWGMPVSSTHSSVSFGGHLGYPGIIYPEDKEVGKLTVPGWVINPQKQANMWKGRISPHWSASHLPYATWVLYFLCSCYDISFPITAQLPSALSTSPHLSYVFCLLLDLTVVLEWEWLS